MRLIIRREEEKDHRTTEELTREAFWNLFVPGCDEHYLVHKLRTSPDFIPELDFIAEKDNHIVGNIMFTHSYIVNEAGKSFPTITFGPVSILRQFQKQGIGSALIRHAHKAALDMGHKAVIIYGYPEFYLQLGFRHGKDFNITDPDGKFPYAMLVFELYPKALEDISGKAILSEIFECDKKEVEAFDRSFPFKEKKVTPPQSDFTIAAGKYL